MRESSKRMRKEKMKGQLGTELADQVHRRLAKPAGAADGRGGLGSFMDDSRSKSKKASEEASGARAAQRSLEGGEGIDKKRSHRYKASRSKSKR